MQEAHVREVLMTSAFFFVFFGRFYFLMWATFKKSLLDLLPCCFSFRHVGSEFPSQGWTPHPVH